MSRKTEEKQYTPSELVQQAKDALEKQTAARPDAYQSLWQAQLEAAMNKILNREPFAYNLNGDALYRQYRDQAIRDGRLAMMDTMGQASALTGGYGSSYAQSVGQQVYQQNLQNLNDRIPELYALALQQYDRQVEAEKQQYDVLMGRENQDYSRYQDALSDWQWEQNRLWDRYTDERGFDYDAYRDKISDEQWLAEFNESIRRFELEWADEHSGGGGSDSSTVSAGKAVSMDKPASNSYDTVLSNSVALMQQGASYQNIQSYLATEVSKGSISSSDVSTINRKVTEVRDSR